MLRRVLLAAGSVIALTAAANAADMYRAPASASYQDTPYVGVDWSGLYVGVNGGYGWDAKNVAAGVNSPEGGFGGGQIGYNVQRGNIVFGLETDIEGSGISASTDGKTSSLDYFGTVRGRLGYAFGRALVYGTGGFAYGQVANTGFSSETQGGWVAGAGVEYKFSPNWSGKAEYQYISLDDNDNTVGRTDVNTVRIGVNYFVNNAYLPLK